MNNIILIGMPGVGKSTIGVLLAKYLSMDFIDTDLLIQRYVDTTLQHFIDEHGYQALRAVEEKVIMNLNTQHTVIATGGSAVYSRPAMQHLKSRGSTVYLHLTIKSLLLRIDNYATRGIAAPPGMSLRSLFIERTKLYRTYADITINCQEASQDAIVAEIARKVRGSKNKQGAIRGVLYKR